MSSIEKFKKIARSPRNFRFKKNSDPLTRDQLQQYESFKNKLHDFIIDYSEKLYGTPHNDETDNETASLEFPEHDLSPDDQYQMELEWFREEFFAITKEFSKLTNSDYLHVFRALGENQNILYHQHTNDEIDDQTLILMLTDMERELNAYIDARLNGKRMTHTKISKYMDKLNKKKPYNQPLEPS